MIRSMYDKVTSLFYESVISPEEEDDIRLGKRLFVRFGLLVVPLSIVGVMLGVVGGSPEMSTVALTAGILSTFNLLLMRWTRKFPFHFSVWFFILMMVGLAWGSYFGGFSANFGTYWVAFLPLLLVILIFNRRWILGGFFVFSMFIILFSLLDPYVNTPVNQPSNTVFNNTYTVLVAAGLILLTISYYKREKNIAFALLSEEREKSEGLLLNILPKTIADRLKVGPHTIADHYDNASILFADLVGFTPLSSQMAPAETVGLLNEIYSFFDSLVEKYNLEKIRTVGDNYMVASGVPMPRPDHASAVAHMALDMQSYCRELAPINGNRLSFRIGIHSGPLVAGVIGSKKFHYDVWGDTVNIASRMESHGVPGKIQVTKQTFDLLKVDFELEYRGTTEIKGKGNMETWFLIG